MFGQQRNIHNADLIATPVAIQPPDRLSIQQDHLILRAWIVLLIEMILGAELHAQKCLLLHCIPIY